MQEKSLKKKMAIVHMVWSLALLLLLSGCGKRSEEVRLEKHRRSVRYRVYRKGSEQTVKALVAAQDRLSREDFDVTTAHLVLGVCWLVIDKPGRALAEADIVGGSVAGPAGLCQASVQVMALHRLGYPELTRQRYAELTQLLAEQETVSELEADTLNKATMLSVCLAGMMLDEAALVTFGAAGLDAAAGLDYVGPLAGVIMEARQGHVRKASERLRELSSSERFGEHRQVFLKDMERVLLVRAEGESADDEALQAVVLTFARRILDDILTEENWRVLLEKAGLGNGWFDWSREEAAEAAGEEVEDEDAEGELLTTEEAIR